MIEQPKYTPRFCEENVWWLARQLIDSDIALQSLWVLFFSNPQRRVAMLKQKAFPVNAPMSWDYHVVLLRHGPASTVIYDLDTRLACPVDITTYIENSFPAQFLLPASFRAWIRVIPARHYLAHFFSDRSHMIGQIPENAFPAYGLIGPANPAHRVSLQQYWDMGVEIDECPVFVLHRFVEQRPWLEKH